MTATWIRSTDERYRSGRRAWDPAVPAHQGHQQAPAADLQQADDLLPHRDAGGGGHPRHPDRHRRQERRRLSAPARQRQGIRPAVTSTTPTRKGKAASPPRFRWPSFSPTASRSASSSATTSSRTRIAPYVRELQAAGGGRAHPAEGGGGSAAVRRAEIQGARIVRIEEKPEVPDFPLCRHRHLHVRCRGLRHHQDPEALRARRAGDHRRQQRLHPRRARCTTTSWTAGGRTPARSNRCCAPPTWSPQTSGHGEAGSRATCNDRRPAGVRSR